MTRINVWLAQPRPCRPVRSLTRRYHGPSALHPRPHIPTELFLLVLKRLDPDIKALSGRQTCKAAWKHLINHTTAAVAQPLPSYALQQVPYTTAAKAVPLDTLLMLMSHAAARMGCVANLALLLALLLQSRLNPQHLTSSFYVRHVYLETHRAEDPGTAAVRWGHLDVLPWLLRTCPGLVNADTTALAAAKACALPALQGVLGQLSEAGIRLHACRPYMPPRAKAEGTWSTVTGRQASAHATVRRAGPLPAQPPEEPQPPGAQASS